MTIKPVFKKIFIALLGLYLFYFIFMVVLFNTSLFNRLSGTKNLDKTNLEFYGTYSLFPGFLHAHLIKIHILDPNVRFEIHITGVSGTFEILPLLRKQLVFPKIHATSGFADLKTKSLEEKNEYQKKYTEPQDINLELKRAAVEKDRKNNATFIFKEISTNKFEYVDIFNKKITGDIKLKGGFSIKPAVEVEVFPTLLTLENGSYEENLSQIYAKALVSLNKFDVNETFGNAVLKNLNIELSLKAKTESLHLLSFIFKTIPGYELENAKSNLKTEIKIINGELEKRSYLSTDKTQLTLKNKRFQVKGFGQVDWHVTKNTDFNRKTPGKSVFQLGLHDIDVYYALEEKENTDKNIFGKIKKMNLHADIFGSNLENLFHGILGDVEVQKFSSTTNFASAIPGFSKFGLYGIVQGEGKFQAVSGKVDKNEVKLWRKNNTGFFLKTQNFKIPTSKLGNINLNADIRLNPGFFDFRNSSIFFPKVKSNFTFLSGVKKLAIHGNAKNVFYLFSDPYSLKGKMQFQIDDTKMAVEIIQSKADLNNIIAKAATVKNLNLDLDWEIGEKQAWLRLNKVNSLGLWSGYGTLLDDGKDKKGVFEVNLGPVPLGIYFSKNKFEYKILPSSTWYSKIQNSKK